MFLYALSFSVVQKHVETAAKDMAKEDQCELVNEDSVLKKLLKTNKTYATLMAIDMFLVGIDTVIQIFIKLLVYINLEISFRPQAPLQCFSIILLTILINKKY